MIKYFKTKMIKTINLTKEIIYLKKSNKNKQ